VTNSVVLAIHTRRLLRSYFGCSPDTTDVDRSRGAPKEGNSLQANKGHPPYTVPADYLINVPLSQLAK
jgi:hypothetical protein